jgi:glyoxylase-like metal-dependent hydrolase (beta-lactamase superfamily II)
MHIEPFYDTVTSTLTYLVFDTKTREAVVIDPVLDYEPTGSATGTTSLERIAGYLREKDLKLRFSLETHAHADHLSGGQYLKRHFDAAVAIGERITDIQRTFAPVFDFDADFPLDGRQFDRLLADGDRLAVGELEIEVLATPGHTPGCVTYRIRDAVFTGDTLFIEDYGTGRCDFPNASADAMYTSIHERLYALPDATRVFPGHDYLPSGRALRFETTVGRSKESNIHLRTDTTRGEFVQLRSQRDATLAPPRLLWPSVQVNIDGGRLPRARANGRRYFATPLNVRRATSDDGTPI